MLSSGDDSIYFMQREKTWRWSSGFKKTLLLNRWKDSWTDMLPSTDRYLLRKSETRRQNQFHADMARGSEDRRSRSQELLNPDFPETSEEWNANNLTTLMFIVASDLSENLKRSTDELSFYSTDGCHYLHIQQGKSSN